MQVFKEENMLTRFFKRLSIWTVPSSAALLLLSLVAPSAHGQYVLGGPCRTPAPCPMAPCPMPEQKPAMPAQPAQPPAQPAQPQAVEPTITPEQSAATGAGESFASSSPNVIGDSILRSAATQSAGIRVGAYKITENESPRPYDRVYMTYNYFNNVNGTNAGIHREMFGFERAVMDGNASFGMRLPIFEQSSGSDLGVRGFGNLNLIGKYAFINDTETGNVLSGGMLLNLPTGRQTNVGSATITEVVLEPYLGYIYNAMGGDLFVQGFSAVAVPTDGRDVTIMFNDIAVDYWLVRNEEGGTVTGIVPTFETHINTPLNHRGVNSTPFGIQDSIVFTEGVHILMPRSVLTLGVAQPITGPKPFDIEAVAQFNLRY